MYEYIPLSNKFHKKFHIYNNINTYKMRYISITITIIISPCFNFSNNSSNMLWFTTTLYHINHNS